MRRSLFVVVAALVFAAIVFLLKSGSDPIDVAATTTPDLGVSAADTPLVEPDFVSPTDLRERVEIPRQPGEPPAAYLAALGKITGRVVDAERQPMADFAVELLGAPLETLIPIQDSWIEKPDFDLALDRRETRTDAEGRFAFDRVEPAAYHMFRLGGGTNREKWDLCAAQPEPGRVVDVGDLILDEYAVIVGRVVDDSGKPIAGARVRASQLPGEFFKFGGDRLVRGSAVAFKVPGESEWRVYDLPPVLFRILDMMPYRVATAEEDGSFRIEGVPLGMISVIADASARLPALRSPVNTAGGGEKSVGDLRLAPAATLSGLVVDGSDEPVFGARVFAGPVLPFFPVALLSPLSPTGPDGAFSGTGFSEDSHVVAGRRPEAVKFAVEEDVVPGIDEPTLRVDETTSLAVVVKDGSGEVVRAPRVFVQPKTELSDATFLQPPLDTAARTAYAEDGSIEVTGLSRSEFNVFAKKEGFAIGKAEADLRSGPGRVEIVLEPERVGSVRVIAKADGLPIEHALVVALDREDGDATPSPIPIAPIAMERTDENGLAVLKGLDDGRQFVRAMHPAYAAIDGELVVGSGGVLVLELSAGGTLKGTIRRDGVAITESHVVVAYMEQDSLRVLPRLTMARAGDGVFEFSRLPEGEYVVQAGKDFESLMMSMFGGPNSTMGAGDPFSVAMLSAFSVGSTRSVRVEAGSADGEEETDDAKGVHVETRSRSGGPDGDDSTGPDAEPGYRAVVKEGQTTTLDIDLARLPGDFPKARLSGIVLVNGAPRAELMVHAAHRNGGAGKTGRTLENGRFDLGEVPAGELDVRVALGKADQISYLAVTRVTLEPNETRSLDLRIEAGWLEGSVRAASDGRPLSEARVRLLPLDSKGTTDYEGCFLTEATGTDGKFRFESIPQGEYKLEVTRSGFSAGMTDRFRVPSRGSAPRCDLSLIETVIVKGRVELPPGVDAPEALFVHFPSKAEIDFSGFVFVDPETREFTVDSVAPGEYDVHVYGSNADLAPVKITVPVNGLPNCILRPDRRTPPPTETPGTKSEDGG